MPPPESSRVSSTSAGFPLWGRDRAGPKRMYYPLRELPSPQEWRGPVALLAPLPSRPWSPSRSGTPGPSSSAPPPWWHCSSCSRAKRIQSKRTLALFRGRGLRPYPRIPSGSPSGNFEQTTSSRRYQGMRWSAQGSSDCCLTANGYANVGQANSH